MIRAAARVLCALLLVILAGAAHAADLPQDVADKLEAAGLKPSSDAVPNDVRALSSSPSFSGPVDPQQYRVGPGDRFVLTISGSVSRAFPLIVTPEGTLALPAAGSISVQGLSLADARARALERLHREYRAVELDLRLERPRTFRVYVTGHARTPGMREATGASRVSDLLTNADLLDDASHRAIELRHSDGSSERVDLGRFLLTGDAARVPYLRDGDVVQVPAAVSFAYAFGALATPGRFERIDGDSLGTLLDLAGGPLPSAVTTRALWLHWGTHDKPDSQWLDLSDAAARARRVSDGDRVFVYFQPDYRVQHSVSITGEVARPGDYPIEEGRTRLADVVEQAGGFLPAADLSAVRVRRDGIDATEKDIELDRLLRLSRNELTLSEYEALQTRLAARREDYRVDYRRVSDAQAGANLLLRSGDIIRAERLIAAVRIDGQVNQPAILSYRPELRLADYVRQAGGYTNRAWVGKIRITRAVSGQTLPASHVASLDPGDFIWVPEKPDVTAWQQVREVLTAVAQIATIVIAIRSVK